MQVLSPQIAALFPADCALLRAERCQRTRRPQIMTKQSRTRSRVQQQQDWKNHLISWRFCGAPAGELCRTQAGQEILSIGLMHLARITPTRVNKRYRRYR